MSKQIVILNDWRYKTAVSYLETSLRTVFNTNVEIRYANADQLNDKQLWQADKTCLFITPPITGEDCHYNEIFTPDIFKKKKEFIHQGGAHITFCAGSYHTFEDMVFKSPTDGTIKTQRSTTPLFKGTAMGPVQGLGAPVCPNNRYSDCIVTGITTDLDQKSMSLGVCYGNGCTFDIREPNVKIIATYDQGGHKLPAMVMKLVGLGLSIASGIVPHYRYEQTTVPALAQLNQNLKPHEAQRIRFMKGVWGIAAHNALTNGTIDAQDLSIPVSDIPKISPLNGKVPIISNRLG